MTTYSVSLAPSAKRAIKKAPPQDQKKIIAKLEELSETPRPAGVEKLSQDPRFWRVRVGDLRIVFLINDDVSEITVLVVSHRKEVYRSLGNIDPHLIAEALSKTLPAQSQA